MHNTLISFLCTNPCTYINNLHRFLHLKSYDSVVITDTHGSYNNPYYFGLTKVCEDRPSAWEYSIYNIASNHLYDKYEYFFFIEDDVYSKKYETFISLFSSWNQYDYDFIAKKIRSKDQEPEWIWWENENNWNTFDDPYKSFNPICRISARLIKQIINYQKIYKKFSFHEILFISLCVKNNYSFIDYEDNEELKKHIGINTVIPELSYNNIVYDDKLYHPYKKLLNK
jgi:hypothetical protein